MYLTKSAGKRSTLSAIFHLRFLFFSVAIRQLQKGAYSKCDRIFGSFLPPSPPALQIITLIMITYCDFALIILQCILAHTPHLSAAVILKVCPPIVLAVTMCIAIVMGVNPMTLFSTSGEPYIPTSPSKDINQLSKYQSPTERDPNY